MLNKNFKTFVVYIVALKALLLGLSIYLEKKIQIASLLTKKITILNKYSDLADIFSKK